MDVDLLAMMVGELILDNDKVSLPGIGSFVSENVPAAFSDRGYTINPPYRRLTFRPIMDEDDLLFSLYSKSNNVDIHTAKVLIETFLDGLKEELQTKKMVLLPGLGRLRATKENNYFFVPEIDLNIDVDNWGLESVSLKTHEETREEVSAALNNLKSIIESDSVPEEVEVIGEVSEEPSEEASEEKSEEPSEEISEELSKETSEEVSEEEEKEEKASEKPLEEKEEEKVSEEISKETPEEVSEEEEKEEKASEKALEEKEKEEKASEKALEEKEKEEKASEKPSEEISKEAPEEASEEKSEEVSKEKGKAVFWKVLFLVIFIFVVVSLSFVVLSRMAPDLVETWLYSPEEIEIINYIL